MELDHPPFDAIVLGCGLAEAVAAAALAQAGKTVLHVDEEQQYGADYASLSLSELVVWARARQGTEEVHGESSYMASQRRRYSNLSWSFPASPSPLTASPVTSVPEELKMLSRAFSLSLAPLIIPAASPLIDTLVASGVSRYSTFRLLESTSIYVDGAAKRVPGSKEDVFKDKSIGLKEKRGLMKVLLWIAGDFEESVEMTSAPPDEPLLDFLMRAFSLTPQLAQSLSYALAHTSSPSSPALPALIRMRRYLRAVGRYGNSPFLVGQYGGAGEVVQGFARLAAVQGAIYILANKVTDVRVEAGGEEPVEVQIEGFKHSIKGKHLIAHPDYLPSSLSTSAAPEASVSSDARFARCIAIFDTLPSLIPLLPPTPEEEGPDKKPDTALLVFPPETVGTWGQTVQVIMMGEGTGSCPAGHYVAYLTTPLPPSSSSPIPEALFAPFLNLLSPAHPPLYQLFYAVSLPPSLADPHPRVHPTLPPADAQVAFASEEGDRCTAEGKRLFWTVFGERPGEGGRQSEEGGKEQVEERGFFEPKAVFEDADEWE